MRSSSGAYDEYADNAEAMITEVAGIPSELACGQASFVPHSKDLVFVGVPPDPNTLGRIYCTPIVATAIIIIIAAAVIRTDRH